MSGPCVPGASYVQLSDFKPAPARDAAGGVGTAGSGWHSGQMEALPEPGHTAREDDGSTADLAAPTNPGPWRWNCSSQEALGFFLDREETPFPDPRP